MRKLLYLLILITTISYSQEIDVNAIIFRPYDYKLPLFQQTIEIDIKPIQVEIKNNVNDIHYREPDILDFIILNNAINNNMFIQTTSDLDLTPIIINNN